MSEVAAANMLPPAEFQAAKRRPVHACEWPARGFGPGGSYTLYLPDPAPTRRVLFRDGEAVQVLTDGALGRPEVAALRDALLDTMRPGAMLQVHFAALAFLRYTTALLTLNYDLTDEELTALLTPDGAWQKEVVRHVLGGPDVIEAYTRLAPRPVPVPPPPAFAAGDAADDDEILLAPAVPWWRRLLAKLLRKRG